MIALNNIASEFRYVVKSLLRDWYYSLTFVIVLSLGGSALLYTYNIYYSFLIEPLKITRSENLYIVGSKVNGALQADPKVSYEDYIWIKDNPGPFRAVGLYNTSQEEIQIGGKRSIANVASISSNFFELFKTKAYKGRYFSEADGSLGAENIAVISKNSWEMLGLNSNFTEHTYISIASTNYRIVGIAEESFSFPNDSDIWVSHRHLAEKSNIIVFGYLNENASSADADAHIKDYYAKKVTLNETLKAKTEYIVTNIKDYFWGPKSKKVIFIQVALAALLFSLAAINLCGLFLSRQEKRRNNLMVMRAVGGTRLNLTKLFVYEASLLTLISCLSAYYIASFMCGFGLDIIRMSEPEAASVWASPEINVSRNSWLFALIMTAVIPLVVLSYRKISKHDIYHAIKDGHGGTVSRDGKLIRNTIVFMEVYISAFIVSVAAILISISLEVNEGEYQFDVDNLISFKVFVSDSEFDSHKKRKVFLREFHNKINSEIGQSAFVSNLPVENVYTGKVVPVNSTRSIEAKKIVSSNGAISVLGGRIMYGRDFSEVDIGGSDLTVIVSESFADEYWPGRIDEAVGNNVKFVSRAGKESKNFKIIGVASDILFGKPFGASKSAPVVYVHYLQRKDNSNLSVITRKSAETSLERIVQIKDSLGSRGHILNLESMADGVLRILGTQVFLKWLISIFGIISLIISVNGIYGLVSLEVTSRIKDIGILKALGLTRIDILRYISWPFVRISLSASLTGVACSVFVGKIFISYYGVTSRYILLVYPSIIILTMLIVATGLLMPILGVTKHNASKILSGRAQDAM